MDTGLSDDCLIPVFCNTVLFTLALPGKLCRVHQIVSASETPTQPPSAPSHPESQYKSGHILLHTAVWVSCSSWSSSWCSCAGAQLWPWSLQLQREYLWTDLWTGRRFDCSSVVHLEQSLAIFSASGVVGLLFCRIQTVSTALDQYCRDTAVKVSCWAQHSLFFHWVMLLAVNSCSAPTCWLHLHYEQTFLTTLTSPISFYYSHQDVMLAGIHPFIHV